MIDDRARIGEKERPGTSLKRHENEDNKNRSKRS